MLTLSHTFHHQTRNPTRSKQHPSLRYILYPIVFPRMLRHPTQSLFLGTLPMGFATIVNMIVFACIPAFGAKWVTLAWVLWWVDSGVAAIIAVGVPFVM